MNSIRTGLLGGGLPHFFWLAYTIAAWVIVPFLLAQDRRLAGARRRLLGLFGVFMLARGVVQAVAVLAGRWNPLYGLAHDLLALLLLGTLRWSVRSPRRIAGHRASAARFFSDS